MIPKNQVTPRNSIEQRVFEEAADARRVLLVDKSGEFIGPNNGIPVYIVDATASGTEVKSQFSEITNVATGATVTILTFTVPIGSAVYLTQIEVSGTNIATYDVVIDGQTYARTRTYFGSSIKDTISFGQSSAVSPKLLAGSIVRVQVTNHRPSPGDFEARLQYIQDPT